MLTKRPLNYKRLGNSVGEFLIDDEFAPWIDLFNWYPSDARRPAPPKVTLRVTNERGSIVPFNLLLNRFVFMLSQLNESDRDTACADPNVLFSLTKGIQRLRFLDDNPWNCTLANISGVVTTRAEKYRALHELPLTAIPRISDVAAQQPSEPSTHITHQDLKDEGTLPPPVDLDLLSGTRAVSKLTDLLSQPEQDHSLPAAKPPSPPSNQPEQHNDSQS